MNDFSDLERFFNVDKVKNDLYKLNSLSADATEVITSNSDMDSSKKLSIFSKSDPVFISFIRFLKGYTGLLVYPYLVEAIVGDFKVNTANGLIEYSKFRAEIYYSESFEVITVDYYH